MSFPIGRCDKRNKETGPAGPLMLCIRSAHESPFVGMLKVEST